MKPEKVKRSLNARSVFAGAGRFRPWPLQAALLALATLLPTPGAWAGRRFDLTLLHTNDIHGHMLPYDYGEQRDVGGAARRAALIDRIKRESRNPVLVIDSGDTTTRGPLWTAFRGKLDIDVMNAVGYDLAAIGNNEFKVMEDAGAQGVLLDMVRRSRFPWLCANAFDGSGAYLAGVKPYLVREVNGVRVAFLGLTAPRSSTYVQTVGWRITDPHEAAQKLLPQIRKEADVVIAVTHIGYGDDLKLAGDHADLDDLDVIVGGDSHTFLPSMTLVQRPINRGKPSASRRMAVPVVQDGEFGRDLGRLDLHFEQAGTGAWELRSCEWRTLPIDAGLPERADVAALIARQAAPLRRPIATVAVPGRTAAERDTATRHLIAVAVKAETGADVALQPADSLFGEWRSGPISRYDIAYVMPFPNHAAVATIKGSDLLTALSLPGMAMAGAEAHPGTGGMITARVGGAPLDPEKSYTVAAEDYRFTNVPGLKGARAESRDDIRDLVSRWLQKGNRTAMRSTQRPVNRRSVLRSIKHATLGVARSSQP